MQVVAKMNRGGLETFIMNVFRNINREEIQFDFLTQGGSVGAYDEEIRNLGGRIYQLPPRRRGIFRYNRAVNDFFKTHPEYKAVHFHISSLSSVAALKAAKTNNIAIRVIHSHSSRGPKAVYHRVLHWWNQRSIDYAGTHYFSCSDLASSHLYGNKLRSKKASVIKNAIETYKFSYNENIRKIVRDKLQLENQYVLGHIGSFSYAKNHDFLLDIFFNVRKWCAQSVLLLVGDGMLRPQIEQKVRELGLENSVIFLGIRSDIADLLQAMDAFVFPSLYEGLPVTGVEAQAAGLKCFFSDNITREVDIAGLIQYISLKETAYCWAKNILSYQNGYQRIDTYTQIKSAGFDIASVAEKLKRVYLGRD